MEARLDSLIRLHQNTRGGIEKGWKEGEEGRKGR